MVAGGSRGTKGAPKPKAAVPPRSTRSGAPAPEPDPLPKPAGSARRQKSAAAAPSVPPAPEKPRERKAPSRRLPGEAATPDVAADSSAPKPGDKKSGKKPRAEAPIEAEPLGKKAKPSSGEEAELELPSPEIGDKLWYKGELHAVQRKSFSLKHVVIVSAENAQQKTNCPWGLAQHLIAAWNAAAEAQSPEASPKPPPKDKAPPKKVQSPAVPRLEREVIVVLCTAANKTGLVKGDAIPHEAQKFKRDFWQLLAAAKADEGKSCTRLLLGEVNDALEAPSGYEVKATKVGYSEGPKKNYVLTRCEELVFKFEKQKQPAKLFVIVTAKKLGTPSASPNPSGYVSQKMLEPMAVQIDDDFKPPLSNGRSQPKGSSRPGGAKTRTDQQDADADELDKQYSDLEAKAMRMLVNAKSCSTWQRAGKPGMQVSVEARDYIKECIMRYLDRDSRTCDVIWSRGEAMCVNWDAIPTDKGEESWLKGTKPGLKPYNSLYKHLEAESKGTERNSKEDDEVEGDWGVEGGYWDSYGNWIGNRISYDSSSYDGSGSGYWDSYGNWISYDSSGYAGKGLGKGGGKGGGKGKGKGGGKGGGQGRGKGIGKGIGKGSGKGSGKGKGRQGHWAGASFHSPPAKGSSRSHGSKERDAASSSSQPWGQWKAQEGDEEQGEEDEDFYEDEGDGDGDGDGNY